MIRSSILLVCLPASLLLSSCEGIGSVSVSACYDKVCGSVGISTKGTPPPSPAPPPTPQSIQVKDVGK